MSDESKLSPIETDDLFVGLATPLTLLGAPYMFTVASVALAGILFLAFNNPLYLFTALPLIMLGRMLIRKDPYRIDALWQYLVLRSRLRRSAGNWSDRNLVISVSPWEYKNAQRSRKESA